MPDSNIVDKLRLHKYDCKLVIGRPDFVTELNSLEFDCSPEQPQYNLILAFVFSLEEMSQTVRQVVDQDLLATEGALIFVYPKKGNKIYPHYIGRDDIFPYLHVSLETGLVEGTSLKFNQMVAFNDIFTATALKQLGAKDLKKASVPGESQSAAPFAAQIPALEQALAQSPVALGFFQTLTPGYQKDWARHVYSAKSAETQAKRLQETIELLEKGFKSLNLYRQSQK